MVSKGMTLFSVHIYFCPNVSTDLSFNSFVLVLILNKYVQRSLAYKCYYIVGLYIFEHQPPVLYI